MDTRFQLQIGVSDDVQSLLRSFSFRLDSLGDAGREDGDCQPIDRDLIVISSEAIQKLKVALIMPTPDNF